MITQKVSLYTMYRERTCISFVYNKKNHEEKKRTQATIGFVKDVGKKVHSYTAGGVAN